MIMSRRMIWAGHVARMVRRGMHTGCWWESQEEKGHWKDLDIGGWTILKWILEREDGMDQIDLDKNRDQWRALVNTVMNLQVP
jgi:hypothetical protein